jgi:hypothetical protein
MRQKRGFAKDIVPLVIALGLLAIFTSFSAFEYGPTGLQILETQATLSACGNVNESSTLSTNIGTAGPCLEIVADNLLLDCAGYTITGNGLGAGINASGRTNVTVQNCNIENYNYSIVFDGSTNSVLKDSNITNGTAYGIFVDESNGILIQNMYVRNSVLPAYLENSYNLSLVEAFFDSRGESDPPPPAIPTAFGGSVDDLLSINTHQGSISMEFNDVNNSVFEHLEINTTGRGMKLSGARNNTFYNMNVTTNTSSLTAIDFNAGTVASGNNTLTDINVYSDKTGVYMKGGDNTFVRLYVESVSTSYLGDGTKTYTGDSLSNCTLISISEDASIPGHLDIINNCDLYATSTAQGSAPVDINDFISFTVNNSRFYTNGSWIGTFGSASFALFNDVTFKMDTGDFTLRNFTWNESYGNLGTDLIRINDTNAFVNTSAAPYLNTSGTVTLNTTVLGITAFKPTVDFEDDGTFIDCPENVCTIQSFSNNIAVFNVSHWTSYGGTQGFGCGSEINQSTTLTENYTGTDTCFSVIVNNVTLDCDGYTLTGNGAGTGINVSGRDNVTLSNCVIRDFDNNVYFANTTNSRMSGIHSINGSTSYGIRVIQSENILIENTNASEGANSLSLEESINLSVTNVSAYATSNTAITVFRVNSSTFEDVSAISSASGQPGFDSQAVQNSTYTNVNGTSTHASASTNYGFYVRGSAAYPGANNTFTNVIGTAIASRGIRLNTAYENTFNNARAYSTSNIGMQLVSSERNNFNNCFATTESNRVLVLSDGNNNFHNCELYGGSLSVVRFTSTGGNVLNNTLMSSNNTWISSTVTNNNTFINTTFQRLNGSFVLDTFDWNLATDLDQTELKSNATNAFINSTAFPLLNVSATITFEGISFTDPTPIVDFEDDGSYINCSSSQCTEISFSGGVYKFNVSGWSSYSSEEFVAAPTPSSSGGGGSSSGGTTTVRDRNQDNCQESWVCDDWGECIDGTQGRECMDLRSCPLQVDRPATERACEVEVVVESPAPFVIESPSPVNIFTSEIALPDWVYWILLSFLILVLAIVWHTVGHGPVKKKPRKKTRKK